MRPDHPPKNNAAQRGFAVITAIFLLLLMAALAAMMVTLSSAGNVTSAQDVQGGRAYQAARSGLEWGIYQALIPASPGTCNASTVLPALANDLAPFVVTVTCNSATVTEGAKSVIVSTISSTATLGAAVGSPHYVERRLQATVER